MGACGLARVHALANGKPCFPVRLTGDEACRSGGGLRRRFCLGSGPLGGSWEIIMGDDNEWLVWQLDERFIRRITTVVNISR